MGWSIWITSLETSDCWRHGSKSSLFESIITWNKHVNVRGSWGFRRLRGRRFLEVQWMYCIFSVQLPWLVESFSLFRHAPRGRWGERQRNKRRGEPEGRQERGSKVLVRLGKTTRITSSDAGGWFDKTWLWDIIFVHRDRLSNCYHISQQTWVVRCAVVPCVSSLSQYKELIQG